MTIGLNPPTVTYYEEFQEKMLLLPRLQIQEKALFRTLSIPNSLMCVCKTIMQGLNEIAENDPSIIRKDS
ncbi:MAG: hypothetical protein ACLR7D_05010 [Lachnospira eligens]